MKARTPYEQALYDYRRAVYKADRIRNLRLVSIERAKKVGLPVQEQPSPEEIEAGRAVEAARWRWSRLRPESTGGGEDEAPRAWRIGR